MPKVLKTKPKSTVGLKEVSFVIPEHTPDGVRRDEILDSLETSLLSEYQGFQSSPIDHVFLDENSDVISNECTKYTVLLNNSNREISKLTELLKGIGSVS